MDVTALAKLIYSESCASRKGKDRTGQPMLCWEAIPITEQHEWIGYASTAFIAVRDHILGNPHIFILTSK